MNSIYSAVAGSWVCWAILALAFVCYQPLWLRHMALTHRQLPSTPSEHTLVLIGALPLLGLLGTIVGLLKCFAAMALGHSSGDAISGGIGDALFTTQLGLVCAVPAWLFQAYVRGVEQKLSTTLANDTYAIAS